MGDSSDLNNLIALFDRPTEPMFRVKGKKSFQLPEEYVTDRYKGISVEIANRFAGDADEVVKVDKAPIPDLGDITSLGRRDNFSLFIPKHRDISAKLINIFLKARNVKELLSIATYAHDRVNPYLFIYCFSVALIHRPDTKGLKIPNQIQTFPDKYLDSQNPIEIPRDYTATDLEEEHRIAYWREDLGINLHHWHWHLVHQQIVADTILKDFAIVEEGRSVDQDLSGSCNDAESYCGVRGGKYPDKRSMGYPFDRVTRDNAETLQKFLTDNMILSSDFYRAQFKFCVLRKYASGDMASSDLDRLVALFDRPVEPVFRVKGNKAFRIPQEFITNRYKDFSNELSNQSSQEAGETVQIDNIQNLPNLNQILQLNKHENFSLFIPKHRDIAAQLIRIFMDVKDTKELLSTACYAHDRRPIEIPRDYTASDLEVEHRLAYWREDLGLNLHHWHWHLVYPTDGDPNIASKDRRGELFYYSHQQIIASVRTANAPITFSKTFWQQSDVDMSRGLDFQERGSVFVRFTHLQQEPFSYNITVNNTNNGVSRRTCRIYIAPANDERGNPWMFNTQRLMFIELDKFRVTRTLDIRIDQQQAKNWIYSNFCGCGWPAHLLIPKGNPEGFLCQLFVMVSNYADDRVEQDLTGSCNDGESYCGVRGGKYPDRRSMGYPFDRVGRPGTETLKRFLTPNMRVQNCTIMNSDKTVRPKGN
ncbi:larval storage protein/phenoloxidase [Holotrichia oblita]|uniref:Larval storage protein/phenoloxidase n=1 Tax=Holotrichia oblita TaxID=644536 RepID=A0ACB9SIP5_HOLOL|nr:larval storage protein/phenoloxidase [Holotrichia oblita]